MEYEVKMLALQGNQCPFEDWYKDIRDSQTRARIRSRITRIRAGNFGDCKSVGSGVNELRLDFGPGFRIYYALANRVIVVLLAGGDKRSQDTDIAYAQELWKDNQDAPERFQRNF